MKTIQVHTELPTTADAVWQAMQHAASFLYVNRGLFGFPALAGRTVPVREGEKVTGWRNAACCPRLLGRYHQLRGRPGALKPRDRQPAESR